MRSRRRNAANTPPTPASPSPPAPGTPAARVSSRKRWLALAVLVAGAAVAVAVFSGSGGAPGPGGNPSDPAPGQPAPLAALTASPFHNTRPGVAYVGDRKCLECHPEHKTYHDHPMGRSLFRAADAPPLEKFDAAPEAFRAGPFRFQVIRDGTKHVHREWCEDARGNVVAEQRVEVDYAVGSGSQARSYLYNRDGFLFESPVTWYALKGAWNLSPGYEVHPLHFTRRIDARCAFCHAHDPRPVEHTVSRYGDPPFGQLAIGCERCHGPGELHAGASRPPVPPGEVDHTIVNPRRLMPALRDAVCEQCHLQGEAVIPRRGRGQYEYRPGLPLHEYVQVFVRPPELDEATKIVGHVEQTHQSACYTKSGGAFGCTSCHDPHRAPPAAADVPAYFQKRCQACHAPPKSPGKVTAPDCALPPAKRVAKDGRTDCLACHMPRNPSVTSQHLAVTDHRLLRRPDQARPLRSAYRPGDIPLVPFHRHLLAPDDPDVPRDLALAALELAPRAKSDGATAVGDFLIARALPLLDRAAARDAGDVPALEARGIALFDRGKSDEALTVFEGVLAKAPAREQALTWAIDAALALGHLDRAETYCRRLVEKYPHYALHHERLAALLVQRKAWPQALAAAEAAVRANPFRAEARDHLIAALVETGDLKRARAELETVGVIDPAYQAKIRQRLGSRLGN